MLSAWASRIIESIGGEGNRSRRLSKSRQQRQKPDNPTTDSYHVSYFVPVTVAEGPLELFTVADTEPRALGSPL